MRPRRPRLSEEARRDLTVRQGNLTTLAHHPAWPTLEAEVERREETIRKLVLAKVLGSSTTPDLEELAYLRGYIDGMRWFQKVPPNAEASLERYLRQQGITIEQEAVGANE